MLYPLWWLQQRKASHNNSSLTLQVVPYAVPTVKKREPCRRDEVPVFVFGKIFISTAYNKGCALLSFNGKKLKLEYRNTDMRNHMATSVLHKGFLDGIGD